MDVYWLFLFICLAPLVSLAMGYVTLQVVKWIIDKNLQKR